MPEPKQYIPFQELSKDQLTLTKIDLGEEANLEDVKLIEDVSKDINVLSQIEVQLDETKVDDQESLKKIEGSLESIIKKYDVKNQYSLESWDSIKKNLKDWLAKLIAFIKDLLSKIYNFIITAIKISESHRRGITSRLQRIKKALVSGYKGTRLKELTIQKEQAFLLARNGVFEQDQQPFMLLMNQSIDSLINKNVIEKLRKNLESADIKDVGSIDSLSENYGLLKNLSKEQEFRWIKTSTKVNGVDFNNDLSNSIPSNHGEPARPVIAFPKGKAIYWNRSSTDYYPGATGEFSIGYFFTDLPSKKPITDVIYNEYDNKVLIDNVNEAIKLTDNLGILVSYFFNAKGDIGRVERRIAEINRLYMNAPDAQRRKAINLIHILNCYINQIYSFPLQFYMELINYLSVFARVLSNRVSISKIPFL